MQCDIFSNQLISLKDIDLTELDSKGVEMAIKTYKEFANQDILIKEVLNKLKALDAGAKMKIKCTTSEMQAAEAIDNFFNLKFNSPTNE